VPPKEFFPLERLLASDDIPEPDLITAVFSSHCPSSGKELRLPRTRLAEQLAHQLMAEIKDREAKMFGILIARAPKGQLGLLKAFSGKWEGRFHHSGWVPPMLELEPSPLEISTKKKLEEIKTQLRILAETKVYSQRRSLSAHWNLKARQLQDQLKENKRLRDQRRKAGEPEPLLATLSQDDSRRKREFKRDQAEALAPLKEIELEMNDLKRTRKDLSRALQAEMHARFEAGLWAGKPWSLASLFPSGPPTGTGECCAPKLLHFARQHNLQPVALAEFWWGESTEKRRRGQFYAPCVERCQPLLGPLLSDASWSLESLYDDHEILVVEKPSGLLTVPGREVWNQDSLVSRLRSEWGEIHAVHRLDLETSGLVVLARSVSTLGELQKIFADRQVEKTYEALLQGCPDALSGQISDSIGGAIKGRYSLCPQGKTALTEYRVLNSRQARVELKPLTGRSHQLRVHCSMSLGQPIVGDPLYGRTDRRLMLHAKKLKFRFRGKTIDLESPVPF
jgi:tRNA pseudouridine32 synthase / 23S rRNA pseudouridine746 synthase